MSSDNEVILDYLVKTDRGDYNLTIIKKFSYRGVPKLATLEGGLHLALHGRW
jgi:hypothetical protein